MRINVENEEFELRPDRSLYWPKRRTLFVADLHWGKAEVFHRFGIGIPQTVLDRDLERLSFAVNDSAAQKIVVLGDLAHNPRHLGSEVLDRLKVWRKKLPIPMMLIAGNHDRGNKAWLENLEIDVWPEAELIDDPFRFIHDGTANSERFTWAGHIHPRFKAKMAGATLHAPCFVVSDRLGLVPAFSEFTAGVDVRRKPSQRIFAVVESEVLEV